MDDDHISELDDEIGGYDLGAAAMELSGDGRNIDTILRIPVTVQVVLGSTSMPVSNLLKLSRGAVIPLDHRVGEPVDVVVIHVLEDADEPDGCVRSYRNVEGRRRRLGRSHQLVEMGGQR